MRVFSIVFVIVASATFMALIFNFSDVVSSIITHKNSIFYPSKLEVYSFNAYAVSMEQFEDKLSAQDYAKKVYSKGAAGYVYESGEHHVLVACYPSLSQAKEIRENLIDLGFGARVVVLKVSGVSRVYKGEDLQLLTTTIKMLKTLFERMYTLSIDYDKNGVSQTQANSVLAQNYEEINAKIKLFEVECKNEKLKKIFLETLNYLKLQHEDTLYNSTSSLNFSANLKRLSIDIVLQNKALNSSVNAVEL